MIRFYASDAIFFLLYNSVINVWDANGNPTEAGKAAGITWTQDQDSQLNHDKKVTVLTAGGPKEMYEDEIEIMENLKKEADKLNQTNIETTGDPIYKDRRPNGKSSLDNLQDSMDKMNEAADDMTKSSDELSKNMVKPDDIATLTGLPDAVAAAVQKVVANIKVYMDSNQVGASVAGGVNGALGMILAQYRK